MKLINIAMLALCILMTGCATPPPPKVWVRAGSTQQDWYRDNYRCQQEARLGSTTVPIRVGNMVVYDTQTNTDWGMYNNCMFAQNWRLK